MLRSEIRLGCGTVWILCIHLMAYYKLLSRLSCSINILNQKCWSRTYLRYNSVCALYNSIFFSFYTFGILEHDIKYRLV